MTPAPVPRELLRRTLLDRLYSDLNRRTLARTDPVSFLYGYENPLDREIVALISSGLAYGRVIQIARSVSRVLAGMPHPQEMASRGDLDQLARTLRGFRHRFTTSDEVVALLQGIRGVVHRYGSLKECMMAGLQQRDTTTLDALKRFVTELNPQGHATSLLASPMLGSACKRLHLFLRWLVRHDDVDPGGWEDVGAWRLVVPMDTHMFRVATRLGLTLRSCADGAAALEVTGAFRAVRPDDPVRYDFALTRLAMAEDGAEDELVSQWHGRESRRD